MTKVSIDKPYYVFGPDSTGNVVEAWSAVRLPFEPDGWLLEMKNSLKTAISQLKPSANTGLYSLYASDEPGNFDVENVLIYNVGQGVFNKLCKNSLCFEKRAKPAQQLPQFQTKMDHYYYYTMVSSAEGPHFWVKKETLACWSNLTFSSLKGDIKAHTYWSAIKKSTVKVSEKREYTGSYGMNIKIRAPKGQKVNLAGVIKHLLDGIISAFHEQDDFPDQLSTTRLATLLVKPPLEIEKMLCDSRTAVLDKRKIIHPFREGIQWNPADDLCVAVKVTLEDSLIGHEWQMDGEMFTVVEQNSR